MHKIKYGKSTALKEHLLAGNKISFLEASILFGVGNLWNQIRLIKKEGFIVKSNKVSMAKIVKRLNQWATCKPPKNLPVKDIEMVEYWINK
jgi:hypothetical protein